jgi:thymidine kinase
METADLVLAGEFCTHHHISYAFIAGLQEAGLVEITVVDEQQFLHLEQLRALEKLVRLHTELDINPEGVEAIFHLLERVDHLQQELKTTKQRLALYERSR